MVVFTDDIPDDPKLIDWIKDQKMFHVASAPLNGEFPLKATQKLLTHVVQAVTSMCLPKAYHASS